MESISVLRHALDGALSRDRARLTARLRALGTAPDAAALAAVAAAIEASCQASAQRAACIPPLALDAALPISAHAETIVAAIRAHPLLILAGETGSGKTTQLPKLCLAAGRGVAGMIGCTQPRRLAARTVARRVAEEMATRIGEMVGFQVRFDDRVGEQTLVKFMTDGILLAETQHDRSLAAYDTLVIDEAHERSLNIDFLLGYLRRLLPRRPDLRVIITSATLDTARFSTFFGDAPVIAVEGRGHPVELRWRPPAGRGEADLPAQVATALDEITAEDARGDVLVFLPGEREIREVHLTLERRRYRHTRILPLYARLPAAEQDRVFHPGPERHVVLATNVAETSLTVPRIRYVIDSGLARVKRYGARSQIERLYIEPIAQDAAEQRQGRCGRVGPGVCVRLYAEDDFALRPQHGDPEIKRSALAGVILRMLALGLGEVEQFPLLDAPQPSAWAEGWRRLAEIGAVDGARKLTAVGRQIAQLPLDVGLARMLIEGRRLGVAEPLRVLVAFLSIQDPRERPAEARAAADAVHGARADRHSDFTGVLRLWADYQQAHAEQTQSQLRAWCARNYLNFMRMREWRELHRQLRVSSDDAQDVAAPADDADSAAARAQYQAIHCALLAGLPTQVARLDEQHAPAAGKPAAGKRAADKRTRRDYLGTRGRRWQIFPGSALAKAPPRWLFSAQVLDLSGRIYGLMNARIEPAWIERQAAHLLRRTLSDPHWLRARGMVLAHEQVNLLGLALAERRLVSFQAHDAAQAHAIFLEQALAECALDTRLDFVHANRRVLEQAERIEAQQRRSDLLKTAAQRAAFFSGKLPDTVADVRALEHWHRSATPQQRAALHWSLADVLDAQPQDGAYPATLEIAGQRLPLVYRHLPGDAADGVSLRLPLALLNALPEARLQWLVPGMLAEKVAELIRGLPKPLRRHFVPAPDFARAFCAAETVRDEPLSAVLAKYLARITGVVATAEDFDPSALPVHLQMRIEVLDEHGAQLAAGRDAAALRDTHGEAARSAFAQRSAAALVREPVTGFDFEDIPERVNGPGGLDAWPALHDQGDSVALQVYERRDAAQAAHRAGVARLLRLSLVGACKRAARQLPLAQAGALHWAVLGDGAALRAAIVEGALRDLLAEGALDVRARAAFDQLQAQLARDLFAAAMARYTHAEAIVSALVELAPWLQPPLLGFARASYDDLHEQRELLLAPGFLAERSLHELAQLPRYLKAMRLRAERLRVDAPRDQRHLLQVLPFWRRLLSLRAQGHDDAAWWTLRWLVEEWRVSLFAQELGTAQPVSPKRLQQALAAAEAATDA